MHKTLHLNISLNVSEKHSSEGELDEWFSAGEREGKLGHNTFPSTFPGPMLLCCALNKREKTSREFSTSELGREGGTFFVPSGRAQHRAKQDSFANGAGLFVLSTQIKEQSV